MTEALPQWGNFLNLRQLAAYSGISARTLRRYMHDPVNPLPFINRDKKLYVKRSTFDEWFEGFTNKDASIVATIVANGMKRLGISVVA